MDHSFFENLTEYSLYDDICIAFDTITTDEKSLQMFFSSNININNIKTKLDEILDLVINNINEIEIEKLDFDFLDFNVDYDLSDKYIDMIENID
jgi:hypothetical protein